MKRVLQHYKITPQYDFTEDCTTASGRPRYRCIIKYNKEGCPKRFESDGYYLSQMDALENAASKALAEETTMQLVPRGVSTRGNTNCTVSSKQKLEERIKLNGHHAKVQYKTIELKHGFRSTAFATGMGYVHGDICRTKHKAEESAAEKALQKL